MSKRYTSGVVSSTSPTVNAAGASGVFTLNQQSAAQSTNNWPPYKIEKSLRFRDGASARLTRTPASASNRRTYTISAWVKLGSNSDSSVRTIFCGGDSSTSTSAHLYFYLNSLRFYFGGAGGPEWTTSQVFRDYSSWYHIVAAVDTTQATFGNRLKLYINGTEVTSWSVQNTGGNTAQNSDTQINNNVGHGIGSNGAAAQYLYDGYMAEFNLIDGLQLTPSSFGATDKDGNWSPIAYTGTYGTNGFYVNFKDATSTSTVGYDYSGNGNNWASSGISVTAGATYDSMIDVPEDQSDGTANNRGNYCTLNPLANPGIGTLSDGNLQLVTSTNSRIITGTMALPSTGQYYFEITATDYITDGGTTFGVINQAFLTGAPSNGTWLGISTYNATYQDGTTTDTNNLTGTNVTNDGDIWCFAIDVTNNKFWVGRSRSGTLVWADGVTPSVNGSGATTISLPSGDLYPMAYRGGSYNETYNFNFGQRPFTHAPPTGFKALNTFNLPEPTIKQPNRHFDVLLHNGNGGSQSITGLNFAPDFWWVKSRNLLGSHCLFDQIRGANSSLFSELTLGENNNWTGQSFNSNGVTADATYSYQTNGSGYTFVDWFWKANGAGVSNTSGSITSTVSANPTAGFSIVTWTGNGTNGATVGHGLGVTPSMVILKSRSSATNWQVKHSSLNANQNLTLNTTAAVDTAPGSGYVSAISSSTLTLLNGGSSIGNVNGNGDTYVAYCFTPIAGYSAFGSYTGNGSSDGPFIYTGFRPRYIMIKSTVETSNWFVYDTARDTYNTMYDLLFPSSSQVEYVDATYAIDVVSNGFKIRQTGQYAGYNDSGNGYIYAAFAETPFKYARAR